MLSILNSTAVFGLENLADANPISFQRYSSTAGLSHPSIEYISQDANGFIWIGTQSGLNIFDGKSFTNSEPHFPPSIENTWIQSILINHGTSEGFIATDSAVFVHNAILGTTQILNDEATPRQQAKGCVHRSKEHLIFCGLDDLFIAKLNRPENMKPLEDSRGIEPRFLHSDSHGLTWIGTKRGLYQLGSNFTIEKTSNTELTQADIRSITSDERGVWVGTAERGLFHFDHSSKWKRVGEFTNREVTALLTDYQKRLWVGTDRGIVLVNEDNEQTIAHRNSDPTSLSNDYVTFIFEDTGKNIWVGTQNGLNKFSASSSNFPVFNQQHAQILGLANNTVITFLQTRDETLWISSLKGLNSWESGQKRFERPIEKDTNPPNLRYMTIAEQGDFLFLGTMRNGVIQRSKSDLALIRQFSTEAKLPEDKIDSNAITKIVTDQAGLMSIATYGNGIFQIDQKGRVLIPDTDSRLWELRHERVIDLELEPTGLLWIATRKSGFAAFDQRQNKLDRYNIDVIETTFPTEVFSMKVSDNHVWLGTHSKGLYQWDKKTKEVLTYDTSDGLAANFVYAIEIDDDGYVWASTSQGLSRLNPETRQIDTFNTSHGLQGDDFNSGASLKLSDGSLLFGGNNGFNAFDPRKIKLNDFQGKTLITSFSKLNTPQPYRYLSDGSETISLTHEDSVFSFEFALMDFASPKDNTYEYQLVGFDDDWVDAGRKNSATYTNMNSGKYLFRVRGKNNDGLLSDKIAKLNIDIAPPPWFAWYAFVIYGLLLVMAGIYAIRLYTQRVERLTNERRNIEEKQRLEHLVAQRTSELNDKILELAKTLKQKEVANKEIHHRVKNNLQVIIGLLTLQAETEENELFQNAMNQIRQQITSMSLIHKSLYENHVASIDFRQYTENLVGSIRQFHPNLANGNIEVLLDVDSEIMDIDTALPVGLTLNELITNSIKHGFPNESNANALNTIRIVFKRKDENYILEVSDNGLGLPPDFDISSPNSMGSELSMIFAQQLSGMLNASRSPEGGASFKLIFPITSNQDFH